MFKLKILLLAALMLGLSSALCFAETDKPEACPDNSTPVLACHDGATCFTYRAIPRMTKVPKFSDYPAAHAFNGKRAADIDFKSYKNSRSFRTRLRDGLKNQPPDYDGHYTTVDIGCGSGCSVRWIVDLETGKIAGTYQPESSLNGADHSLNSSLIAINTVLPDADMCIFGTSWKTTYVKLTAKGLKTVAVVDVFKNMAPYSPPPAR